MLSLFRPELSISAGICTVAGQVLAAGALPSFQTALLGFLCAFALSSTALILNDYFDFEVDLINAPERPLPSGAVTKNEVIFLAITTSAVGLAAAFMMGIPALLLSILFWLIGILYNWRFKQTGLPGNLMVSASVAVTFILGAMTVHHPYSGLAWIFGLMSFFIDLGEEIAGDAMDMEGDKKIGSRSIALIFGKQRALFVSVICWGLVIVLGFFPLMFRWIGSTYLIFILITDALLVIFSIRLLKSDSPAAGRRAMRGIYLGATLALVAFLIGLFL